MEQADERDNRRLERTIHDKEYKHRWQRLFFETYSNVLIENLKLRF